MEYLHCLLWTKIIKTLTDHFKYLWNGEGVDGEGFKLFLKIMEDVQKWTSSKLFFLSCHVLFFETNFLFFEINW